jgi:hypothetical protein
MNKSIRVTLYPFIPLNNLKWGWSDPDPKDRSMHSVKIEDPRAATDVKLLNSRLIDFKNKEVLKSMMTTEEYETLISAVDEFEYSDGSKISACLCLVTKNVEYVFDTVLNIPSQNLLEYLIYTEDIDRSQPLNTIDIFLLGERRFRYVYLDKKRYYERQIRLLPNFNTDPIFKMNSDLVNVVGAVNRINKSNISFFNCLISAFSNFNNSCMISCHSEESSIVLLVAAYESIFQTPKTNKQSVFSYAFKLTWGFNDNIFNWATALWELRNKIVHGSYVEPDSLLMGEYKHCRFFDVGREFFKDTLYRIVDLNNYISISENFKDYRLREFINRIRPNHEKLKEIIKRKNEFNFKAMKANKRLYRDLTGVIDSIVMTDRSMKKNYYKVVKMMCVISKDWFNDYETNLDSWPTDDQRTIKLFLSAYKEVIDRIDVVNNFNELNSKGLDFHELLRAVQDRLRNFGPIVEYPKKPRFELNDFIARWLRVFEFCFF